MSRFRLPAALLAGALALSCGPLGKKETPPTLDRDGDTFAAGVDCDDESPVINPAAVEVCRDDGIDNDCDSAREDEDSDCKPAPRELQLLGGGSRSRLALHLGATHDLLVEVSLDPPPAAGETQLVTEPTTIDALTGPLARLQGQLAGRPVTIHMVAFLYARQLVPDGAYRYDLEQIGKWLLFGAGDDYYLAWTRVEQTDPVQVVAVSCKDPLPDRPMRVPLPVRPLKIGEVFELDLGGGVKRSLQVMSEAIPARGW
jgi:hypothetical protein